LFNFLLLLWNLIWFLFVFCLGWFVNLKFMFYLLNLLFFFLDLLLLSYYFNIINFFEVNCFFLILIIWFFVDILRNSIILLWYRRINVFTIILSLWTQDISWILLILLISLRLRTKCIILLSNSFSFIINLLFLDFLIIRRFHFTFLSWLLFSLDSLQLKHLVIFILCWLRIIIRNYIFLNVDKIILVLIDSPFILSLWNYLSWLNLQLILQLLDRLI